MAGMKEEKAIISKAMRILGSRTSDKKKASSRKNGKLGGKPKGKRK